MSEIDQRLLDRMAAVKAQRELLGMNVHFINERGQRDVFSFNSVERANAFRDKTAPSWARNIGDLIMPMPARAFNRYERLRELANKAQILASEIRGIKGDFEATEFDYVEQAEDSCDSAFFQLKAACGGRWQWLIPKPSRSSVAQCVLAIC